MNKRYILFATLLLLLNSSPLLAEIQLPPLLSDNAILQRDTAIPIWGKAPADTLVDVTLGLQHRRTRSDRKGNWSVEFSPRPAGKSISLKITAGKYHLTVNNLLFGDLWVCSGQSNMEWPLRNSEGASTELAQANFNAIRHFKVPRSWARLPKENLADGNWTIATGEQAADFSAVGYYFARRIHSETATPIGLIGSNWGGSRIEAWMSADALGQSWSQTEARILELERQSEEQSAAVAQYLERWPGSLVEKVETASADWRHTQLETQDWHTAELPGHWESNQLPNVDGVIWYRKTFTLNNLQAGGDAVLHLGAIDDNDTTYINGVRLGSTSAYDVKRAYPVQAERLNAGVNVIAVRVEDTGGNGGFYGGTDALFLQLTSGDKLALSGNWQLKADKVVLNSLPAANYVSTALYNKMLYPLFRTPVKGVIWYQGESNANNLADATAYSSQFKKLIGSWRKGWGQAELPFYWVQLANYNSRRNAEAGKPWAILRQAQTEALELPHTGQAVIIDAGDANDIHPRNKTTVGERLARIALNKTYGIAKVHYRGPVFKSARIDGSQIIVSFDSAVHLRTRSGGSEVRGVELANHKGETIEIISLLRNNQLIIPISENYKPVELRYAWDDNPENANLIDSQGLPAEPFRTTLK